MQSATCNAPAIGLGQPTLLKAVILAVTASDDIPQSQGFALAAEGCIVETLQNAEDVIPQVIALKPDLILIDAASPGLDSADICRELKQEALTCAIPVLVVTDADAREERLRAIEAGANDLLTRPLEEEELLLRIRNAVQARRMSDRHQDCCDQFKKLEAMRENLTHMMVHDIRNLVQGVIANVQLLKIELQPDSPHSPRVEELYDSARKLLELSITVLDINRLEQGQLSIKKRPHAVVPIIHDAVKMLGGFKERCHIRTEFGSDALQIHCDTDLVRRVIFNLLDNAVKFTRRGGIVCVRADRFRDRVKVSVSDCGPGIPAKFHGRMFEKEVQAELRNTHNLPSTGLGLAFCKLVVDAHEGQIGVLSNAGEGSTFWFDLPG
ncbi:MAG: ATP-binding protein [Fibrobacterota bacterium]